MTRLSNIISQSAEKCVKKTSGKMQGKCTDYTVQGMPFVFGWNGILCAARNRI